MKFQQVQQTIANDGMGRPTLTGGRKRGRGSALLRDGRTEEDGGIKGGARWSVGAVGLGLGEEHV